MRKPVVGAVAHEDGAVVKRQDGDIAEPAVGVAFEELDVGPCLAFVARDRRREGRAASVRPCGGLLRLVGPVLMVVPHGEEIARRQALDGRGCERGDERRGLRLRPRLAAVGRVAHVLAAGVRSTPGSCAA